MGENQTEKLSKRHPMPKSKPGPKPELLKINGNWERAVTQSLRKTKPANGWPK